MMENTRHSHRHPTGRLCHWDVLGAADSPKAPDLEESNLFISGPTFKQLREPVDSAQLVSKQ